MIRDEKSLDRVKGGPRVVLTRQSDLPLGAMPHRERDAPITYGGQRLYWTVWAIKRDLIGWTYFIYGVRLQV